MAVSFTAGYQAATDRPLTCSRLLPAALPPGTVSATGSAPGYPATDAATPGTAAWWCPATGGDSWQILFDTSTMLDAVALLGTYAGIALSLEVLVAGDWQEILALTPTDNEAVLHLFAPVAAEGLRITPAAPEGADPAYLAVIACGQALVMRVPEYSGAPLLDLAKAVTPTSYVSDGGQFIARFVQRKGRTGTLSWEYLPEGWYREVALPFTGLAETLPFFVACRPDGYPTDCVYAWTSAAIVPKRMGVRDFLSVSFEVTGYAPF